MSKTAVIIALLVAAALGIAAWFLLRGQNTSSADLPRLFHLEPGAVTEIRTDFPDGSFQSVRRGPGGWRVHLGGPGRPEGSWPAAESQVHPALRIFADLKPDEPATGSIAKPAGTLTIKSGDATETLKIGDQRLAGRVLVESKDRAAWVDANIAEMLITTGIRAWRSTAALPGLSSEPSRIGITGHAGGKLSLAKVQGKWFLREPFAEPADAISITRLIALLNAARIEDFCDGGPPAETGLETPTATLVIETDTRDASGKSSTIRQSITVGRTADVGRRNVIARLERTGDGGYSEVFILAGDQLAAISADAAQYLSPQPIQVEASDIGQVHLIARRESPCSDQVMRRTIEGGWELQCAGGAAWSPTPHADTHALTELLVFLTQSTPEKVLLRSGDAPASAKVQVASAGGTPIGEVEIVIEGARLVILTEKVRREYPAGAGQAAAEWLGRR